jgi:hypothetical protein
MWLLKQQLYEKTQIGEFWSVQSVGIAPGLYLGRCGYLKKQLYEKTQIGEFWSVRSVGISPGLYRYPWEMGLFK